MGCRGSKTKDVSQVLPSRTGFHTNTLGNGDILFFSDDHRWSQSIIRIATHSKWTHVGMVVYLPELYPHGTLLLESSGHFEDGLVDVLTGVVRTSGVRLVDLSSRIQFAAPQEIACRRWNSDFEGVSSIDNRMDTLTLFSAVVQNSGKPYEKSALQLSMSAFPVNQQPDESSLFCSELVAVYLQKLRILSSQKSANSYTPKTFTKKSFGVVGGVYTPLEYIQKI